MTIAAPNAADSKSPSKLKRFFSSLDEPICSQHAASEKRSRMLEK
jgi:hypothetical protein